MKEINGVKEIFIFGSGKAKVEFEKEMKKINKLASKKMTIELADKMTDNQIIIKVKEHFNS